mgnify:CR=1 FL=1
MEQRQEAERLNCKKLRVAGRAFLLWAGMAAGFSLLCPGGVETAEIGGAGDLLRICLLLPAAEELVFRGGVQRCLRPLGAGAAIGLQAVLFAALHGSLRAKCYALGMGLIFGWAAQKSGSLLPGMGLHLLNNGIVLAQCLTERRTV